MSTRFPRVLDTSALLALFAGHPELMRKLDLAQAGDVALVMPTLAIAETEAAVQAGLRMWEHFLRSHGVRSMDLTEHTAIETGGLAAPLLDKPAGTAMGPWMIAQTVWEARSMNAAVITQRPDAYADHDVDVEPLD